MVQQTDSTEQQGIDPLHVGVVAVLVLSSLFVWSLARNRVVAPLDDLVTEQACASVAEQNDQIAVGHERSNRFGLSNRSHGFCSFSDVDAETGEAVGPARTVPLSELELGSLYRAIKVIGLVLQFGIVSIFLRLIVDPLFTAVAVLRERLGPAEASA